MFGIRPRKENSCVERVCSWLNGANASLLDTFSSCHELAQQRFTCWMQLANLRYCNKGARLDYILCDKRLFGTQSKKWNIVMPNFRRVEKSREKVVSFVKSLNEKNENEV